MVFLFPEQREREGHGAEGEPGYDMMLVGLDGLEVGTFWAQRDTSCSCCCAQQHGRGHVATPKSPFNIPSAADRGRVITPALLSCDGLLGKYRDACVQDW